VCVYLLAPQKLIPNENGPGLTWVFLPMLRPSSSFSPISALTPTLTPATFTGLALDGREVDPGLEFGPETGAPNYPRLASPTSDVFDRAVLGFVASLHLQLGRWP